MNEIELKNIEAIINKALYHKETENQYLILMKTIKFCQKRTHEIEKRFEK